MNELLVQNTAGTVTANFDEIKTALKEQLNEYKGLIFTEETKKSAKDTVAQLRKDKKAIEERVKDVKKEYMKPFDDFYAQAKELSELFDEPICFINEQIDDFEKNRIAEKKTRINALYVEIVDDMVDILPLPRIYNDKWENATYTEKQIKEDLMNARISAKEAIETIKGMGSEAEERAIEVYKLTLNVTEAIKCINSYEAQKREILEREREKARQEELDRIREEERLKLVAEQEKATAVEEAKAEAIEALIPEQTDEVAGQYLYSIELTASEKEKLEMYMDSVGISYKMMGGM